MASEPTPAWKLRQLFNEARVWERCKNGDLVEEIIRDGVPTPENKQPPGTRSITARIRDQDGQCIAYVHYYRLPDGRINNRAGRPDPKWCFLDGETYRLEP